MSLAEILGQLRRERAVLDEAIRALERVAEAAGPQRLEASAPAAPPAAPAAPARNKNQNKTAPESAAAAEPTRKARRAPATTRGASTANESGPCAYDPKIRGREVYAEVLRALGEPTSREELLKGAPPQRSKALNKMAEHGLVLEEDGFVRITEAGELYLADAEA